MDPISNEEQNSTECKVVRLAADGIDQSNFLFWNKRCDFFQFALLMQIVLHSSLLPCQKEVKKKLIL